MQMIRLFETGNDDASDVAQNLSAPDTTRTKDSWHPGSHQGQILGGPNTPNRKSL